MYRLCIRFRNGGGFSLRRRSPKTHAPSQHRVVEKIVSVSARKRWSTDLPAIARKSDGWTQLFQVNKHRFDCAMKNNAIIVMDLSLLGSWRKITSDL
jgi:hypothetical protein